MTAFSSLEILSIVGRHGSQGPNLEMLRSGLFEEQLKLASQSSRVSEDEAVWGGLPMIKKTLPIGPPTPAPPPEVKDAPGRDEKLEHGSAPIKKNPKSTSSAGPATSERTFSTRRSAHERSFRQEGNQYDQTYCSGSSPMGPDTDPLSDADSRSSDEEVVPASGEATSAEESHGQQSSEGIAPATPPLLEMLPGDTEQIISPSEGEETLEPIGLPSVGGQVGVAGGSETLSANPVSQGEEQPAGAAGAGQLAVNGAKNTASLESPPAVGAESGSAILSGIFQAESEGSGGPGSTSDAAVGARHSGVGGEQPGNNLLFIMRAVGVSQAGIAAGNPSGVIVPVPPGLLQPTGAISETAVSAVGSSAAGPGEPLQAGQTEGSGRATVAGVQAAATSSGISPGRGVSSADPASGSQGAEGTSQEVNVQRVRFIQRVARAFQSLRDGGGSIRLRLHPPELGSLRVELLVRDGALRARMEVENQAARTTILEHLPTLRERLAQQDIRIEQFEVEIGQEFSGSHSQQPGSFTPEHQGPGFSPSNNRPRNAAAVSVPTRGNPAAASDGSKLNVVI